MTKLEDKLLASVNKPEQSKQAAPTKKAQPKKPAKTQTVATKPAAKKAKGVKKSTGTKPAAKAKQKKPNQRSNPSILFPERIWPD